MRVVGLTLTTALVLLLCVAGLLLVSGHTPPPNPNFTNLQLPTLDTP